MIEMTRENIGGKAFHLRHISSHGVNVPEWIVLPCEYFDKFLGEQREQFARLLDDYDEDNRGKLTEIIQNASFPEELQREILQEIKANFAPCDRLAIRSSAADEDGDSHSFAGMLESYLDVPIDGDVLGYIKRCYLSCFSERAMEYRRQNGMVNKSVRMAVIIQKMIDADYAGVMFTTNPQTNNPDETLISVVEGVGETLVSGERDSTDYVVDCEGKVICTKECGAKLPENILRELFDLGQLIEKSYEVRRAQDVEFCVRGGTVYILQCRPIVAFSAFDKGAFRTVLDNSNIIESYFGVTTPLTFTFAREVYSKIYRQTLRSFFIKEQAIDEIADDLDNMLAFYQNKIYYRLNSWYKMTALYPGYEKNKKYMENMMGVKTTYHESKAQAKTRLLKIYTSFIGKMLRMKKDSRAFVDRFNAVTAPYYNNSFEGYTSARLLEVYDTLEKEILDDFITPIANDMGAMIFFGMLTDRVKKYCPRNYEGLLSGVLGKQGNVESAGQSNELREIVSEIRQDPTLYRLFAEESAQTVCERVKTLPIGEKLASYVERFGPRTMDELKLETVTLLEDPTPLFETVKQYLSVERFPGGGDERDCEKELYLKIPPVRRPFTKRLIKITKFFIRNRESLRLRRTYIYSIVRKIYLGIGRNFEREGLLENARDIFFLEKDEITETVRSNAYTAEELREKVDLRRSEYERNRDKPAYERMVFCGELTPENCQPIHNRRQKSGALSGVAGGGGIAVGTVKLVESPADTAVKGYILMAKRTDPGWTVLFPLVKAIIIERGSVLSHSAVIAREMGIPLVVGVSGLTDTVKDGMRVKVDGTGGTIEIVGEQDER